MEGGVVSHFGDSNTPGRERWGESRRELPHLKLPRRLLQSSEVPREARFAAFGRVIRPVPRHLTMRVECWKLATSTLLVGVGQNERTKNRVA